VARSSRSVAWAGFGAFSEAGAGWTLNVVFAGIVFVGWKGTCGSVAVDLAEDPNGEAGRRPL